MHREMYIISKISSMTLTFKWQSDKTKHNRNRSIEKLSHQIKGPIFWGGGEVTVPRIQNF